MKRIIVFLVVTFALTWAYEFGIVYPIAHGTFEGVPAQAIQLAFMGAMLMPALGVLITRLATREGFKNSMIKPRAFRKSFPWFLVAWFGPSVLILTGAVVYFELFPGNFDPHMTLFTSSVKQAGATGLEITDDMVQIMVVSQLAVGILAGPLLNIVTTFGEEWGWRGYLVPKMATQLRIVPTLLVTGIIWGLWHAPLIALGHNYGLDYPGFPLTGILAMCGFCIVCGIFLSYVTIRTGSCLAAAFGHGALNAMAAAGTIFAGLGTSPFVGPAPTGIVGGSALIVVAVVMLWDLHRREKVGTLELPQAGLPDGVKKGDLPREHAPANPPA